MSSKKKASSSERDKKSVEERLKGFTWIGSRVHQIFMHNYGRELKYKELHDIVEYIAKKHNLTVDRQAKRRLNILQKWCDENFDVIEHTLRNIVIEDENGSLLTHNDDNREAVMDAND